MTFSSLERSRPISKMMSPHFAITIWLSILCMASKLSSPVAFLASSSEVLGMKVKPHFQCFESKLHYYVIRSFLNPKMFVVNNTTFTN